MKAPKLGIVLICIAALLLPGQSTVAPVQAAPQQTDLAYKLFLPLVEGFILPPTLLSPENNSMFYIAVDLTWTPVPDAFYYNVYASNGLVEISENTIKASYTFFDPGNWTWKVRAVYHYSNYGPWSESKNFSVYAYDYSGFYENGWTPLDGSEIYTGRPLFVAPAITVNTDDGLAYYKHDRLQLQIALDPNFDEIIWETLDKHHPIRFTRIANFSFVDESFDVWDILPEGTYYWKVRAIATDGITISDWSDVRSISVLKPYQDCLAPGPFTANVSSAQIPGYPHIGYLIVDNNAPVTGDVVHFLVDAGVYIPAVYPIDRLTVQVMYNTGVTPEYEGTLIESYDAFNGRWQVDLPMPGSGCYSFMIRYSVHNAVGSQVIITENKPTW